MKSLLLAVALMSAPVFAETSVVAGGWSYHIGQRTYWDNGIETPFNETNETIGIGIDSVYLVYSKLSYNNDGLALYKHFKYGDYFGFRAGVVYGYGNTPENLIIAPLFAPTVTVNIYDGLNLDVGVIVSSVPVLTANFEYRF